MSSPPGPERTIPNAVPDAFQDAFPDASDRTGGDPADATSTRRFAVRDLCRGALVAPGLTLEEEVGRGGCGVVWSARWVLPSGIEKRVAVKRLRADAGLDPDPARRLRDEARLLARISHRAIVRVEDVLVLGATPAILTEYVDGLDLGVLLDRGAIPPLAAAEVLAELASALEAAHAGVDDGAGLVVPLVHRDVKPGNVRLTRWGEIKLLDFGAAHAAILDRESATRGFLIGSPGYLAPEAYSARAGPAADIYALGVLAWECRMGERLGRLSSQRLVQAEQVDRAMARLSDPSWGGLVARMVGWDPMERPSAAEVRQQMEALARVASGISLREWAAGVLGAGPAHPDATASAPRVEATAAWGGAPVIDEVEQTQTQVEILPAPAPASSPSAPVEVLRLPPDRPALVASTSPGPPRSGLGVVALGAAVGLLGGVAILVLIVLLLAGGLVGAMTSG